VVPDGYQSTSTFWRSVDGSAEAVEIDFPLVESGTGPVSRFVHASDVHLRRQNLSRIRKLREIVEEQQPAFVLITRDLIHDALRVDEPEAESYHRLFLQEIQAFPVLRHHRVRGAKWPSR
jgi:predicted MPP superfamily phosphohydrolase